MPGCGRAVAVTVTVIVAVAVAARAGPARGSPLPPGATFAPRRPRQWPGIAPPLPPARPRARPLALGAPGRLRRGEPGARHRPPGTARHRPAPPAGSPSRPRLPPPPLRGCLPSASWRRRPRLGRCAVPGGDGAGRVRGGVAGSSVCPPLCLQMPPKKGGDGVKSHPIIGRFGTSLKIGIVGLPNVG